ncbi:putative bifunctional inhibitor/plant lipid transfer protein/seed storage helical [Medicago truncatula]|uniref:Lipid transfer protein n=1 Tax=Medicago truncatula TaxID=3880 RepID=A0A072UM11_MEDTR|nr:putative lipid-transfer protein DIR1 [Medicago truncatula]KEH30406.1 Lipid transfer protein [Medicago truncatula]RHN61250.1 putative bifunctional inhibitor/plant lipid transfer protein/seed storage helical [Medicago truncatula]
MDSYKKVMIMVMLLAIGNAKFSTSITICNLTREERETCEPYVSGENSVDATRKTFKACCSVMAKADLECFCRYKNSILLSYYGIDPKLALELPVKCKLRKSFKC